MRRGLMTSSTVVADECFEADDCNPDLSQAGPRCCGYHCCECDGDDSECGESEHRVGEVCMLNP